jgi:hypothetical protein
MNRELRIANRIVANGQFSWEISGVSKRSVSFQFIYDVKTVNPLEVERVKRGWKNLVMRDMKLLGDGLPINLGKVNISDPELVNEGGNMRVVGNVVVEWLKMDGVYGYQDVEEVMMDEGLM